MRLRTLTVALVGAGALVAGPVAAAQAAPTYPPSAPTITLSADVVAPGQSVVVTGTGFQAVSDVTLSWTGPGARGAVARLPLGSRGLTATATGSVSSSLVFQAVGQHTVSLLGVDPSGAPLTLSASLVVQAAGVPLAHTGGSSVEPSLAAGLALLLLGTTVVLVVRRRRAQRSSAPVVDDTAKVPAATI
jgi:LPXTG-motif cell wall-anchored protein